MEIKPEILDIIKKFQVKEPILIDSTLVNIDNDLYFITDGSGKKFVVREAKRVREKDSEFEANLLSILNKANTHTLRIVQTKSGDNFLNTAENWPVFVFEFIEGKQYEASEIELNPKLAYLGGEALGKLHTVAINHKNEIGENRKRNVFTEFDAFLARDLTTLSSLNGFEQFRNELKDFKSKTQKWMVSNPNSCGAIHSDYGPQNTIFTENNCYIIDFDWACFGPFPKDVGQGIALWVQPTKETVWPSAVAKQFIDGYNKTAPKTVQIDSSLVFWSCFACLSDTCTFFLALLDGQYSDIILTDVSQCHGYKRYLYFKKYL